jgi:hypothetical protein
MRHDKRSLTFSDSQVRQYFLSLLASAKLSRRVSFWSGWIPTEAMLSRRPQRKCETEYGIKVSIETPEEITDSFSMAAQAGKGPDIVILAHDKLGEWTDGGLRRSGGRWHRPQLHKVLDSHGVRYTLFGVRLL